MAEALLAVGVAANVVQLLDVGARFMSNVRHIYAAAEDETGELPDLKAITEDFEGVLADLEKHDNNDTGSAASEYQQSFKGLVIRSQAIASELLEILRPLTSSGGYRRRDALAQAFKEMWKDRISPLEKRLDRLRQQLTMHLLALIRHQGQQSLENQAHFISKLNSLEEGSKRMEQVLNRLAKDHKGIGDVVVENLSSRMKTTQQKEEVQQLRDSLVSDLQDNTDVDGISTPNDYCLSDERTRYQHKVVLNALAFHEMNDRERRISEAHKETFNWLFEDTQSQKMQASKFRLWLESESQLFWITGKAGSGKSTLMKHISSHILPGETEPQCTLSLRKWADPQPLLLASYFFWNSGSPIQMSQYGLLSSLLWQTLTARPELIPLANPSKWESMCLFNSFGEKWSEHDLLAMLYTVLDQASRTSKIGLFVDGLDEFDGDHAALTTFVRDLTTNPGVKICISSRPLNEFEDAFGQGPNFMLHELTYADIKQYVSTRLSENKHFVRLQEQEEVYSRELVHNVVAKASGVFLWVSLVVTSLLEGMQHGDRVVDLQMRLDMLPPDLEDLYVKILKSLDPLYRTQAAEYFKLMELSEEPIPLLVLWFADEPDQQSVLERSIGPLAAKEAGIIKDTMQRRLRSRTRGLLEANIDCEDMHELTIRYLHRTVKDFLRGRDLQETLDFPSIAECDARKRLCLGLLVLMKTMTKWSSKMARQRQRQNHHRKWNVRDQILHHASF